ncbi:DUF3221 domain-containing protein [Psychrobacillus glaciei]|uniref:DUF3221 domain-containing protein n=1 Tax=Psychrobacillus glaciei TaxID=2283160 RepID=A0A5J6SRY9_9BACI|nr:DUF3221 domain-containing protein [Psychrobacillus glaciei]QFG00792.1 DUF3221 domain-containing protein [Psychrobacillus glaciei]
MKLLRYFCTILIFLSFVFFITGCAENRTTPKEEGLIIEGYILEVYEGRILLAKDITSEQYETLKDKTLQELGKERISLFYLRYEDTCNRQVELSSFHKIRLINFPQLSLSTYFGKQSFSVLHS